MKIKKNYIAELKMVLKSNDKNKIEETLDDFYYDFYEAIETDDEDNYYEYKDKIIDLLYKEILKKSELNINIGGHYDEITGDLIAHIVFPFWYQLIQKINQSTLREKSIGDPGQKKGDFLQAEMGYIAESIYYRYTEDEKIRKIMSKEMILFLEARMKDLTELILMGRMNKKNKEKSSLNNKYSDIEEIRKFQGNSLQKRNKENNKKYARVAKIMKIAENNFPQLKMTQKTACEIADCNNYSFVRWKNYTNNFDTYLNWQENISTDEIEILKKEILNYYKLHSDM
jgi:hypothetical protein